MTWKFSFYVSVFIVGTLFFAGRATASDEGTYDAILTTDSGSYTVPVEVENGEVAGVNWPNGGDMTVNGAELEDGEASGTNSNGDSVHIEIDDPSYGDTAE